MVDMAHFAGLVAAGVHPTPFGHAHVVTTTTHKTLRGPRGGMVLTDDEAIAKKINSAVFPGLQGGPLMHVIAAKAVAFGEALQPEFKSLRARGGRERQGARRDASRSAAPTSSRAAPTRISRWSTCARSASPARTPTRALERAGDHLQQERHPIRSAAAGARPAASASARPRAPRAASARPSSATSPTWSPTCSTGLRKNGRSRRRRRSKRNVRERVRALCARFPIYPDALMRCPFCAT